MSGERLFEDIMSLFPLRTNLVRAILHEENVYGPDALDFRPERFLGTDVPLPESAFGFGRRVCPGQSKIVHFKEHYSSSV